MQEDGLADVPYSTIVYVPADYLDIYKQHVTWGNYDVRPIDGSAVENVTLQGMCVEAGMLVFGEPTEVSVYTAAGNACIAAWRNVCSCLRASIRCVAAMRYARR